MAERYNSNRAHVFSGPKTPDLNTASEQTGDVAGRDVAPMQVELTPGLVAEIIMRQLCPEERAIVLHSLFDHPESWRDWFNRLMPRGGWRNETEVAHWLVRVSHAAHGVGQA